MATSAEDEIKFWLEAALKNENLSELAVTRQGNTGRGDGYMGDIVFVDASGKTQDNFLKSYNLVLKCSKKSQKLRETIPVKQSFENEIHLYENIIPAFRRFQEERGVREVFNSVPKFYGSFVSENMEVVVLQNLIASGYYLLDKKQPVPNDHLKLILEEYGKWHAISAAMQDQKPEQFKELVQGMKKVWKLFAEQTNAEGFFAPPIQEVYELLEDSLESSAAQKVKAFKTQISAIMDDVTSSTGHFSVITHCDCWSNNFMFKSEDQNGVISLKVSMLDWQVATFCSPVADLSYFIHACSSEEDLKNSEGLLRYYYDAFSSHVRLLGSDPERIFPFSQLLKDFRILGKYGIMLTILAIKVALSDNEETIDFAETAGDGFENTFGYKNRDPSLLRKRMKYIIEHTIKHNLL